MRTYIRRVSLASLLVVLATVSVWAEDMNEKRYSVGDTVFADKKYKPVQSAEAAMLGLVEQVDDSADVATIRFYSLPNRQMKSLQKRVASGRYFDKKCGEQLYFHGNGEVRKKEMYALILAPSASKAKSRMIWNQYFDKKGNMSEMIVVTNPAYPDEPSRYYDRKCFHSNGVMKYQEIYSEDGMKIVYYDENGRKTETPSDTIKALRDTSANDEQTFVIVETMPEFPGGQQALFRFLGENVKYPPVAFANGIEGRVICQFVVGKDGSVSNVKVVRSAGDPSLDAEAVRVLQLMPKWRPGSQRGKAVRVKYTVPINFGLKSNDDSTPASNQ